MAVVAVAISYWKFWIGGDMVLKMLGVR
jgi:hypothetical protein